MAKRRKKQFSQEEKKAYMDEKIQSLQSTLEEGVKSFEYSPETYKAILEMQALLPRYSFKNLFVAKAQLPSAGFIAPFKRWKELGRYPRKGETSLRIFAPVFKKEKEEGQDGSTVEKQKLMRFVAVPIFDVSQTEGDPLPIDKIKLEVEGDSPEARLIMSWIHDIADLPIDYVDTGSANGLYYPFEHRIEIHKGRSINQQAKTLVHEYVHSLAHGIDSKKATSREKEVVAEGSAFVVCSYFGLDTSDYSFEYVRGWSGKEKDAILTYGEQISSLSRSIIKEVQNVQFRESGESLDIQEVS